MKKTLLLLVTSFLLSTIFNIYAAENRQIIYSNIERNFTSFDEMTNDLANYDVVYLGEQHDKVSHHESQKNIMQAVSGSVGTVSVGLEFLKWPDQEYLNQYVHGTISEEEFLTMINWGNENYPFDFYGPLIDIAYESGGHAFGLNAPKWLTNKITKQSINSLTSYEFTFIPPMFQLGSDLYKRRFNEVMDQMDHPIPPHMIENLFQSQSVWDETMSFHAVLNLKHSYTPFFIIVGNFHIAYKLGSPASIKRRIGPGKSIVTVYHVDAKELTEAQIYQLTTKHPIYGSLADYIVFTF